MEQQLNLDPSDQEALESSRVRGKSEFLKLSQEIVVTPADVQKVSKHCRPLNPYLNTATGMVSTTADTEGRNSI